MINVVDWLAKRAQLSPNKIALIDTIEDQHISFSSWNAQVNKTAHFLQQHLHIEKGDRVSVLATNSVAYLDIWFACAKIGAIMQNLNWRLTPLEQKSLIKEMSPKALFYSSDFKPQITKLKEQIKDLKQFIALEDKAIEEDISFVLREQFPTENLKVQLDLNDPWVICYTGGSTGLPKGAILTHGTITANAINTVISWGLSCEDTAILNAPLFHTGALNVFTAPLVYAGGTSFVCKGFDAKEVFALIEKGANLFFGVPTMFTMLQEQSQWQTADFSKVKLVISGGAPCPMPVFEKFWQKKVNFKTGYGLTEAGPNNFWLPDADIKRKPGAVGFPLFHVEVKLIDSLGKEILETDTPGELLIRGPHRVPGYWKNPEATAKAIDDQGWLYTGDLAQRDCEGYYYIVGRCKEMFISGGENVYPAEIESVLYGYEKILEAAVVGIPDEKWGEVGKAFVVKKEQEKISPEELKEYCRQFLAAYKIPKSIEVINEMPKTGAGKIDKKVLIKTN